MVATAGQTYLELLRLVQNILVLILFRHQLVMWLVKMMLVEQLKKPMMAGQTGRLKPPLLRLGVCMIFLALILQDAGLLALWAEL